MKRNRMTPGKLAFSRETLRNLSARQLAGVVGGGDETDEECDGNAEDLRPCKISLRGGDCPIHCGEDLC